MSTELNDNIVELMGHVMGVYAVTFSPDGNTLASGGMIGGYGCGT